MPGTTSCGCFVDRASSCWSLVNGLAFWLGGARARAVPRHRQRACERIQRGDLAFRLPPLPGTEASAIGAAFNRMAQAVEDKVQAERKAREAETRLEERREMARSSSSEWRKSGA